MTPSFNSLAAFKAALTLGSRWEVRRSYTPGGKEPAQTTPWHPREVARVQTNAVAFANTFDAAITEQARARPHANAMWLWFPKAKCCSFPEPGVIRIAITEDPDHWIEYRRFVEDAADVGEAA